MSIPQSGGGPIERHEQLAEYLASGCKPKADWRIGTEHEKFGYCKDTLKPLPSTADALGDVALALWAVVAAGLILVLGDNLLGLGRLATLVVGGRYPTAAESYGELNASIMKKTTPKYLVPPCR